jgi:quinol monooxygenase YgiN
MAYVVTATWTAKDGHEDEVRQAILDLVEPSRAEPGNLFYQANQDPEDPRVFFLYELYTDEVAYAAHGSSEHFQRLGFATAIPLLESRERKFYETVGPLAT